MRKAAPARPKIQGKGPAARGYGAFREDIFSRSALLLGEAALETLRRSRVAVFGVGGVGGYAAEALARSGVGELHLIDNDTVSLTNLNRQIIALHSTIGRPKAEVMRERVLDIFEKTTGGRVIFSVVKVGGVVRDIDDAQFAEMKRVLEGIKDEYRQLCNAFLKDSSVKNRTVGVGYISHEDALAQSMVGPFARASNVNYDARMLGNGGYGFLSDFQPILDGQGDCYARVKVRALEVLQSIDIIEEMIAKIPAGDIAVDVKGSPAAGAEAANVVEQPRGECYYYARGNGSKFLDRMRMRTPTSQNLAGMATALAGCDLADVNMIVLTIDPCISCTER